MFFSPLSVEDLIEKTLSQAGYTPTADSSGMIIKQAQEAIEKVLDTACYKGVNRITELTGCEKGIVIGRDLAINSQKLSNLVSRMDHPKVLGCFAVTLGNNLDRLISKTMNQSLAQAFLMDAAGTVIIEHLADQAETQINQSLKTKNLVTTRRFSPGYCDWEVIEGQKSIFSFLDLASINITRLPSGMMNPEKSVTAVIVGAEKIEFRTPCSYCVRTKCQHRRAIGVVN